MAGKRDTTKIQDLFDGVVDDDLNFDTRNNVRALDVIAAQEIRTGAFLWTPVGLQIEGEITRDDWEETGRVLKRIEGSLQWLIGDWVNYGLDWGDREEFANAIGFSVQTIYEYAKVAKAVDFRIRIPNLTFGHHQVVKSHSIEDQEYWLGAALEGDELKDGTRKSWSIDRLRKEIQKVEGRSDTKKQSTLDEWIDNSLALIHRVIKKNPRKRNAIILMLREWADRLEQESKK